jgi:hypothetical protein
MTPDELELVPARLRLVDLQPEPARRRSSRRIWRGIDGGQSVLVLQVMGQMWARWDDWGDLRNQA